MRIRLRVLALALFTAVMATFIAPTSPASAAAGHVCYQSYIAQVGWQSLMCDGPTSGTEGQSRTLERISMTVSGTGGYCARVHVGEVGWTNWVCAADGTYVLLGVPAKRIEALNIGVNSGQICGDAHVQGLGWTGTVCGSTITIGSVGQSRRMEAYALELH